MNILDIFNECKTYNDEQEWFEFKLNHVNQDNLGEYISALSK